MVLQDLILRLLLHVSLKKNLLTQHLFAESSPDILLTQQVFADTAYFW